MLYRTPELFNPGSRAHRACCTGTFRSLLIMRHLSNELSRSGYKLTAASLVPISEPVAGDRSEVGVAQGRSTPQRTLQLGVPPTLTTPPSHAAGRIVARSRAHRASSHVRVTAGRSVRVFVVSGRRGRALQWISEHCGCAPAGSGVSRGRSRRREFCSTYTEK